MANDAGSSSSTSAGEDILSPRKKPRFDFVTELKKLKEQGKSLKLKDVSLGRNVTQELKVAVSWKNRNNSEKFFSFHGFDGSDFMVFKVFQPAMNEIMNYLELFETYVIKNFNVQQVDEKYKNDLNSKFEIILSPESVVQIIEEVIDVPLNRKSLGQVAFLDFETVIDVLGVLVDVGQVRKTGIKNKSVREVSLFDESKQTVPLYFWEKDADEFNQVKYSTIGFRKLVIKDYNGEKVLWFQWYSTMDTTKADKDGQTAAWFYEYTGGAFANQ